MYVKIQGLAHFGILYKTLVFNGAVSSPGAVSTPGGLLGESGVILGRFTVIPLALG